MTEDFDMVQMSQTRQQLLIKFSGVTLIVYYRLRPKKKKEVNLAIVLKHKQAFSLLIQVCVCVKGDIWRLPP